MTSARVVAQDAALVVTWPDATQAEYPFIWLRDNDPGELHPHTRERLFHLTSVQLDVEPESFERRTDGIVIRWPDRPQPSSYSFDWLRAHRPGIGRHDPAQVTTLPWNAAAMPEIARFDATTCHANTHLLGEALLTLKRFGIVLITGLADERHAGEQFGDLVGFKRRTNFGVMFEVINKPEPNNVAYTALALPLHTDLPNQEIVPGYQFLHCCRNSATGGKSVFADGFRIAKDLRADHPEIYELLKSTGVPFRFHDTEYDIRCSRPLVAEDREGNVCRFVFNAHIADVPDMPAAELPAFYAAYRKLMLRTRDPRYAIKVALAPGEMVLFDNTRILHGRTAFAPASGERYLRGYYIDKNEVDSRIRVLARKEA